MPIIQPSIIVPEDVYSRFLEGKIEIKGLAKTSDTQRVFRHLDVIDNNNNLESDNTTSTVAGITAFVLLVAAAGFVTARLIGEANRRKGEEFRICLNEYITAVNEHRLSVEILERLIAALDKLKRGARKRIRLQFSTNELATLVECLCNHTQTLAKANHIHLDNSYSAEEQEDILLRLRKNLILQRDLFIQEA